MSNNPNRPHPNDAVLGGQSLPPTSSAILGGLEGVKWRLKSQSQEVRIAALLEALKYGTEGLKVLTDFIQTETGIMKWTAYNFLWERADETQKEKLRKYSFKVVSPELIKQGMVRRLGRGSVNDVIFLNNELVVVCASGGAALFNIGSGEALREIDCPAHCGAMSTDGTILALGGNRDIYLWDLRTGQLLWQLQGHSWLVIGVAFSGDGKLLASGSGDYTVRLWNVISLKQVWQFEGHTREVKSVAFSPNGKLLASGSEDETVRLWDVASGELVRQLNGHTLDVKSVAFSPNGKLLASGSGDNTVRFWDVASGEQIWQIEGHTHGVENVAFSADGKLLASVSWDGTVRLWKMD